MTRASTCNMSCSSFLSWKKKLMHACFEPRLFYAKYYMDKFNSKKADGQLQKN